MYLPVLATSAHWSLGYCLSLCLDCYYTLLQTYAMHYDYSSAHLSCAKALAVPWGATVASATE
jgi:hypothetical protein